MRTSWHKPPCVRPTVGAAHPAQRYQTRHDRSGCIQHPRPGSNVLHAHIVKSEFSIGRRRKKKKEEESAGLHLTFKRSAIGGLVWKRRNVPHLDGVVETARHKSFHSKGTRADACNGAFVVSKHVRRMPALGPDARQSKDYNISIIACHCHMISRRAHPCDVGTAAGHQAALAGRVALGICSDSSIPVIAEYPRCCRHQLAQIAPCQYASTP